LFRTTAAAGETVDYAPLLFFDPEIADDPRGYMCVP
jgi:hypothetical protein